MKGVGLGADRVLVTFHEDYASYIVFLRFLESQSLVVQKSLSSYLITLNDKNQFLPLSFDYLAGYILKNQKLSKTK